MLKTPLNARLLELLHGLLPFLIVLAIIEFIATRVIGRLTFMYAGNPILIATYNIGTYVLYASSLIVLISMILVSSALISKHDTFTKLYGALYLILVPVALLAISYAFPLAIILAALAPIHLLRSKFALSWPALASIALIVTAFLAISLALLLGKYPILRIVGEVAVVASSVTLFVTFRKFGSINWLKIAVSIALPFFLLIIPKYLIPVMPWTIRQVATFSLNFQFIMPLEVYALAMMLFLATIFRLSGSGNIARYGLVFLLLGGLPQWNVYPLLVSLFGLVLTILAISGRIDIAKIR